MTATGRSWPSLWGTRCEPLTHPLGAQHSLARASNELWPINQLCRYPAGLHAALANGVDGRRIGRERSVIGADEYLAAVDAT